MTPHGDDSIGNIPQMIGQVEAHAWSELQGSVIAAFEDPSQLFTRDRDVEEEVCDTLQVGVEPAPDAMVGIGDLTWKKREDVAMYDENRASGHAAVGECGECKQGGVLLEEDASDGGRYCIRCWLKWNADAAVRKEPSAPTALPIEAHRSSIVAQVREQRVTCIEGETGCGKSSMVPVFLVEEGRARGKRVRVLVTQPRRIAATSLARRVAHQVRSPPNPRSSSAF